MIKSHKNWHGMIINGVILGDPAILEDGTYAWDHEMLPNAIIDDEGNLVVSSNELDS